MPDEYDPTEPSGELLDAIGIREGVLAERHILHTPDEGRYVYTTAGTHDPIVSEGAAAFMESESDKIWTAKQSVEAIWGRLATSTLIDNATALAIEPGRALRFGTDGLHHNDVLLVGPKGVLRINMKDYGAD